MALKIRLCKKMFLNHYNLKFIQSPWKDIQGFPNFYPTLFKEKQSTKQKSEKKASLKLSDEWENTS